MKTGWIDEVVDGWVYGRFDDEPFEFSMPITDIQEEQRVDLQPGSYFTVVNGTLLLHKTIYITHEIEHADEEAARVAAWFAQDAVR